MGQASWTHQSQRPSSSKSHNSDTATEGNARMGNKFQRHRHNVEEGESLPYITFQTADHLIAWEGHNSPAGTGLGSFPGSAVSQEVTGVKSISFHALFIVSASSPIHYEKSQHTVYVLFTILVWDWMRQLYVCQDLNWFPFRISWRQFTFPQSTLWYQWNRLRPQKLLQQSG